MNLDPFSQMLAAMQTAAHLDVLGMQGRLAAEASDEVTGYCVRRSRT